MSGPSLTVAPSGRTTRAIPGLPQTAESPPFATSLETGLGSGGGPGAGAKEAEFGQLVLSIRCVLAESDIILDDG